MSEKEFEVNIITKQKDCTDVVELLQESKIDFTIGSSRGFAPSSDTIIQIVTVLSQLLPIISVLVKKIWSKGAIIDFKTRRLLANEMLSDLAPFYQTQGEDRADYSYYEFETVKGKYFWELDRGEIKYGPVGSSTN
jgi:hypothetical protein